MIARRTSASQRRPRLAAAAAALLALVGIALILVAAGTSRPAPPEPTAANAGAIARTPGAPPTADGPPAPPSTPQSSPPPMTTAAPPPSEVPPLPAPGASTEAPPTGTPSTGVAAPSTTTPAPAGTTAAPHEPLILPDAAPVSLSIPAIGAASDLLHLGLNGDGSIATPPIDEEVSHAGWFDRSPEPGTLGPAILLGHIDSVRTGPAIFYNLAKLAPGDTVEVTRSDGTVAIFAVDGVREYPKDQFPTLQVYGNLDHAGLRLITCGGVFDDRTGHYESNVVVFASLIATRAA